MRFHKQVWMELTALMLASLACNALRGPASTPVPESTSTPLATVAPPPTEPAPTSAPERPSVLPAPLYFISSVDQQIWRMEADGTSLTQITGEQVPIAYYDVSPADSSLAYVSNNDLIRVDALGANRTVLFDGPDLDPQAEDRIVVEVSRPHWSPDGSRISFGFNGVNVVSAGGGQPEVIMQSDPYPNLNNPTRPDVPPRFYLRGIWSPDGTKLLIESAYYPEGGAYAVKSLTKGSFIELASPEGILCCNPAWSGDNQYIYFANDSIGLVMAGLWRSDAASGVTDTLVTGGTDAPINLFSFPYVASDGQLYFFYGQGAIDPNTGSVEWPPSVTLSRADADGTRPEALRADTYKVGEALWSADGSGAVILELSPGVFYPFHGPLIWLDAADNAAVTLPADGGQLRWGK